MKTWSPLALAFLLAWGASPAQAAEAPPPAGAPQANPALRQAREARREALQHLSPEQRAALRQARQQRRAAWQAMSPEQRAAAKAQHQARRQARQQGQGNPTR